jgi:hypothetical protein
MLRRIVFVSLFLFVRCTPVFATDLMKEPRVVDMFSDVLLRSINGPPDAEAAAFIVRDADGSTRCVLWPSTGEYHAVHYRSAAPAGIVAIVHTHPRGLPVVSPDDRMTAIRLGIPVYAITLRTIYEADADGNVIAVAPNANWSGKDRTARLCSLINHTAEAVNAKR